MFRTHRNGSGQYREYEVTTGVTIKAGDAVAMSSGKLVLATSASTSVIGFAQKGAVGASGVFIPVTLARPNLDVEADTDAVVTNSVIGSYVSVGATAGTLDASKAGNGAYFKITEVT